MAKKVLILGGIGNGSVIANAMVDANNRGSSEWEFAGYLNDRMDSGNNIEGYPVMGKTTDWRRFMNEGYHFINTIFRIDG